MNGLVQKAYEQGDIHVVLADGMGYTLYMLDMDENNRVLVEVYDELGEVITYHQGKVYNHQEVDEATWNALDGVFSSEYRAKQLEKGNIWSNLEKGE